MSSRAGGPARAGWALPDAFIAGRDARPTASEPGFQSLRVVIVRTGTAFFAPLLSGSAGKLALGAMKDRVEAPVPQVKALRFLVGHYRAPQITPANLPHPAHHRMAALAIAEEIIDEVAHHRAARLGR